MNRNLYRKIAKMHGVSVAELKREMQSAIDEAYIIPTPQAMQVPRQDVVPTVDEFIDYSTQLINTLEQ